MMSSIELIRLPAMRGAGVHAGARKAALILRPETVHDEGIGPAAPALLVAVALIAFGLAIGRRPGKRQYIEIELAGFVAVLGEGGRAKGRRKDRQAANRPRTVHGRAARQFGA
jgi:hypothetical protein